MIETESESPSVGHDMWAGVLRPNISKDSIQGRNGKISEPRLSQETSLQYKIMTFYWKSKKSLLYILTSQSLLKV